MHSFSFERVSENTITMEFAAGNAQCSVCHYRTSNINLSNTIIGRHQFLSLVQTANLKEAIPFGIFFKQTAIYIAAYLRKMSLKIASKNGQTLHKSPELIVLKLRGNDKNCALYHVNDVALLKKIEQFGVNKNKQIVYVMTDLLRDNQYTRTLRNYFKDHYMFESYDLPMIFEGSVSFFLSSKFSRRYQP